MSDDTDVHTWARGRPKGCEVYTYEPDTSISIATAASAGVSVTYRGVNDRDVM
jgi:hypothetical protein